MRVISLVDFKQNVLKYLNETRYDKRRWLITKNDERLAALVSLEDLERIESLEAENFLMRAQIALESVRQSGTIPLEVLKEELMQDA
ncbi:MAG: type II toxin-antitoxin system Phd/YefM family antitoxin [Gammaproteobacteria bacterium]